MQVATSDLIVNWLSHRFEVDAVITQAYSQHAAANFQPRVRLDFAIGADLFWRTTHHLADFAYHSSCYAESGAVATTIFYPDGRAHINCIAAGRRFRYLAAIVPSYPAALLLDCRAHLRELFGLVDDSALTRRA